MFSANSSQVSDDKLFVEDVFSTFLYTGNGSTQTITNGIDLAGKGGLVWNKGRSAAQGHALTDTVRGAGRLLQTNSTGIGFGPSSDFLSAFNSNGFSLGSDNTQNGSGTTYASWTFREAPKFFDVVTYTGDGVSTGRNISHNLGVRPGFIIVKRTDSTSNWAVLARDPNTGFYHGGVTSTPFALNLTNAKTWSGGGSAASATTFNVCHVQLDDTTNFSADFNVNGATYVAYLFAHDPTADGIIQCGSFTTSDGVSGLVNVGFEPQWVLIKRTDSSTLGDWQIYDNMRGMVASNNGGTFVQSSQRLQPNTSAAEATEGYGLGVYQQGFNFNNASGTSTYIYVAIRRPMKTPTLGTSVFFPSATTSSNPAGTDITTGFPVDMQWDTYRLVTDSSNTTVVDRLRGVSSTTASSGVNLVTSSTAAESTSRATTRNWGNTGYQLSSAYGGNGLIAHNFRRAPGFFDEVCYTGINATRTVTHNLGVVPELIIVKNRTTGGTGWPVWATPFSGTNDTMLLNTTAAASGSGLFTTTPPTSTVFTVANDSWVNSSGNNYVAYLFASCPGVSKVGSYTGNGSSQTINCGFAAGARFILIKRTDSTGGWFVWDTARGIVAGNDPYLMLNSSVKEDTGADSVDTDSSGFVVNQDATTNVNVSSATYIYLAIA